MKEYALIMKNVTVDFPLYTSRKDMLTNILRKLGGRFRGKTIRDRHVALDDISLKVKKGEVIGILGKNGSGKSTLLQTMARVYQPSKGRLLTDGEAWLLSNISTGFNSNLTGVENIMLKGSLHGFKEEELKILIPEITEYSGVGSFINQPLKTYSSGMGARLAFALTCHLNPKIILLDELMSVGDFEFSKKSSAKIKEMVQGDATAVIATHSESILKLICDRVFYIEKGKIIPTKDVDEAIELYRKYT